MCIRKLSIILMLISCMMFGQSIFNAYGIGMFRTSYHTSVNGAGSIGLVPTFHPGVSMDNPATWPGLKFTFISGSFSNRAHGIKGSGITNQAAGFNKIQFVQLNFVSTTMDGCVILQFRTQRRGFLRPKRTTYGFWFVV